MSSQVLTPQAIELHTFARLMRAHTVLRRELEAEVLTPRGLSFNDFEALLQNGVRLEPPCGSGRSACDLHPDATILGQRMGEAPPLVELAGRRQQECPAPITEAAEHAGQGRPGVRRDRRC